MAKLSSILQQRFKKKEKEKTAHLAKETTDGNLTVFSGMFGVAKVGEHEKQNLLDLLQTYASDETTDVNADFNSLVSITSEVKAINNQAAILHGERIKKAQTILKNYREGAFTAWLLTTYGNRQTPYNFLQYYDFHNQMPKTLHPQIEIMPRQAIYTLASREGDFSKKEEIVRNYKGETKQQMVTLIRSVFPLKEDDKRREDVGLSTLKTIHRLIATFENSSPKLTAKQRRALVESINQLQTLIER